MIDLDRFDPAAWMDEIFVLACPASGKRTRSASKQVSWLDEMLKKGTIAVSAAAMIVGASGIASQVSIAETRATTSAAEARLAKKAADEDAASPEYWTRVARSMQTISRHPELAGQDPELPDYDDVES
jgi:hypothetical protein